MKIFRWILFSTSAILLSAQAMAAPAHNPELTALSNGIRNAAHAAPLRLRKLDIDVQAHGAVAQITVDAAFINLERARWRATFALPCPTARWSRAMHSMSTGR
jgi:hypothetical protein